MALSSTVLRLRRPLTALSSTILRSYNHSTTISSSSSPSLLQSPNLSPNPRNVLPTTTYFLRSPSTFYSSRSSFENDPNPIGPDDILFEGCDYNHWLITMDFPKDPKPTPEEMVETYVQTAAKVFGSVEEAKKKIYACSTTTYQGFQCVMSEEVSTKFQGLPGVVFILPDSYIDPVNKEYGGDKYENGVITPRPPPITYGRGGRQGDRNRNYDRPNYRQRDPMPPQGDGGNYRSQQGYAPRENYSQQQNYSPQQNYPPQQNYARGPQQNYSQGPQQNYSQSPPQNYPRSGPQQNYPPQGPQQGYSPPGPGQNYSQPGPQQNYSPQPNPSSFAPSPGRDYRQGFGTSYGQGYPVEQGNGVQGDQTTYNPTGQTRNDQGPI